MIQLHSLLYSGNVYCSSLGSNLIKFKSYLLHSIQSIIRFIFKSISIFFRRLIERRDPSKLTFGNPPRRYPFILGPTISDLGNFSIRQFSIQESRYISIKKATWEELEKKLDSHGEHVKELKLFGENVQPFDGLIDLEYIVERCPNLKILHIFQTCFHVRKDNIRPLETLNLEELILINQIFTDRQTIECLKKMGTLKRLSLDWCSLSTENFKDLMHAVKFIKILNLNSLIITGSGRSLNSISTLKLHTLSITLDHWIGNYSVTSLFSKKYPKRSNLKSLAIGGCNRLDVPSIVRKFPFLEILDIDTNPSAYSRLPVGLRSKRLIINN